jgi:hypothetical protein
MRAARTRSVARKAGWAAALAAVGVVALAGCGGEMRVHDSSVPKQFEQAAMAITLGETDRAALRQLLGQPWVSSEYWQFELFRLSGRDVDLVVTFVPLPVPFMYTTDKEERYLLVQYDTNGKVSAFATSVSGDFGHDPQVGEVIVFIGVQGQRPDVFVSPQRRDEYLATQRGGDYCSVLVSCPGDLCFNYNPGLIVDRGESLKLSKALLGKYWLTPLILPPGRHRLEATATGMYKLQAETEFSCTAGDLLYVALDLKLDEAQARKQHWSFRVPLNSAFSVSHDRHEGSDLPLLIWRDGTWLLPTEP